LTNQNIINMTLKSLWKSTSLLYDSLWLVESLQKYFSTFFIPKHCLKPACENSRSFTYFQLKWVLQQDCICLMTQIIWWQWRWSTKLICGRV